MELEGMGIGMGGLGAMVSWRAAQHRAIRTCIAAGWGCPPGHRHPHRPGERRERLRALVPMMELLVARAQQLVEVGGHAVPRREGVKVLLEVGGDQL